MFGKIIGRIISTPVRLANVPLKIASKVGDAMLGYSNTRAVKDRDPLGFDEVADAIDKACESQGH